MENLYFINRVEDENVSALSPSKHLTNGDSQMSTAIYYVYAYLREDDSPYYIGKGKGKRVFAKHDSVSVPKDRSRILMLAENLSEESALELEKEKIAFYGRKDLGTGILRNMTDGGDGISGYSHKETTKEILREKRLQQPDPMLGRKHSEQTKEKMSLKKKGKPSWNKGLTGENSHTFGKTWKWNNPMSEEAKLKNSERMTGEKNPFYGKTHNEESLKKIRNAPLGKKRVYREDGTFYMARPEEI